MYSTNITHMYAYVIHTHTHIFNAPMCEFLGFILILTLKLPGNSVVIPSQVICNAVHIFFFDRNIKYRGHYLIYYALCLNALRKLSLGLRDILKP